MSNDRELAIRVWERVPADATHINGELGFDSPKYRSDNGYRVLQTNTGAMWDIAEGLKPEDLNNPPFITRPHFIYEELQRNHNHALEVIAQLRKDVARYEYLIDEKMKHSQ